MTSSASETPETNAQTVEAGFTRPGIMADYQASLPFPLDGFQQEAIAHIDSEASVVVCAPTGAGKTVIAEFAATKAINDGVKLFYTTPLKALSNQKYHDLKARFGEDNVGLLTGDMSVNREARIVVMTTEVFRNMLYGLNEDRTLLQNLGYVVLDECHFMNDADRGTVWEESMVYCPPHVRMIALSATVANAQELTRWINTIHPPCKLVWSDFRPVPLRHYYFNKRSLSPLFDAGTTRLNHRLKDDRPYKAPGIKGQRGRGGGGHHGPGFEPGYLIDALWEKDMLPAIVFTFSRKGCERHLRDCMDFGLVSFDQREEIKQYMETFCAQTGLDVDDTLRQALLNGVASHHAGLLPGVKMLVEGLFQKGLLKVIFATETLAAGINMPARSTVITAISKRTDVGHRTLTASEFLQMSGRAGRRGMDTVGHVVIVGNPFHSAQEAATLASSPADPLNSRFTPTYGMVLNLLQKWSLDEAEYLVNKSFGAFTSERRTQPLTSELNERKALLEEAENFPCPHSLTLADFKAHLKQREKVSTLNKQIGILKKQAKKQEKPTELLAEIARMDGEQKALIAGLEAHVCSPCEVFKKHRRLEERVDRWSRQVKRLQGEVEEVRNVYWQTFLNLFYLLKEVGYIDERNKPTPAGIIASKIRTENEVFVTEAISKGLFDNLAPEALAAVVSALVNDSNRENVLSQLRYSKEVRTTLNGLAKELRHMEILQHQYGVQIPMNLNPSASPLVEAWGRGMSWGSLMASTTMDQGDLVRNLRRTMDLLRQLSKIPDIPQSVSFTAHLALLALYREPVKEIELGEDDFKPRVLEVAKPVVEPAAVAQSAPETTDTEL